MPSISNFATLNLHVQALNGLEAPSIVDGLHNPNPLFRNKCILLNPPRVRNIYCPTQPFVICEPRTYREGAVVSYSEECLEASVHRAITPEDFLPCKDRVLFAAYLPTVIRGFSRTATGSAPHLVSPQSGSCVCDSRSHTIHRIRQRGWEAGVGVIWVERAMSSVLQRSSRNRSKLAHMKDGSGLSPPSSPLEIAPSTMLEEAPSHGIPLLKKGKQFHLARRGLQETSGFWYISKQPKR